MKIAFVVLYLNYGVSGTVEIPQHFATMEECQKTFDDILVRGATAQARWGKREIGYPVGTCVPVMIKG